MKVKKYLALILSTVILANSVMPAFATESGNEMHVEKQEYIVDVELPENDILFEGYAGQFFYETEDRETFSVGNRSAGAKLSGDEKLAYDALIPIIKNIAAGDRSSAVISLGESFSYEGVDYNVDSKVSFMEAASEFDVEAVIDALLLDYPYEMYWYDKTTKSQIQIWSSGGCALQIIFNLYVSGNYQDGNNTTVDVNNAVLTKSAAEYAKSLVKDNEDKSDYEKLLAYKDAICNLVTYDNNAADVGDFTIDNDPWQLIYVFDRNDSTNVVCEGYAKAFQYLCDMTSFETDVSCYSVTGVMSSSTSGGAHMWNIVTMDGQNYLVDVTNCDSGTIGYPDELFLCGTKQGNTASGYTFEVGMDSVLFSYDEYTKSVWGTDELTLADSGYTSNGEEDEIEIVSPSVELHKDEQGNVVGVKITNNMTTESEKIWYGYLWDNDENAGEKNILLSNAFFTAGETKTILFSELLVPDCEFVGETFEFSCYVGKDDGTLDEVSEITVLDYDITMEEQEYTGDRILVTVENTTYDWNTYWIEESNLPEHLRIMYLTNSSENVEAGSEEKYYFAPPWPVEGRTCWGASYENAQISIEKLNLGEVIPGETSMKFVWSEVPQSMIIIEQENANEEKLTSTVQFETTTETLKYTGETAVITAPVVKIGGETIENAEIAYSYRVSGSEEAYISGLPTDVGIYEVRATLAEGDTYKDAISNVLILVIEKTTSTGPQIVATGTCDNGKVNWTLNEEGLLEISGEGIVENCFDEISLNIKRIIVHIGITSIGENAFSDCSELKSIELPKGLKSIEYNAFSGCSKLTSVELPEGVMGIGDFAFYECSELENIELPKGLISIGDAAFNGCSKLISIEIPEGVTSIGTSVFGGCTELKNVKLPEGIKSIERNTFLLCSNLTSIELPEGVASIGEYAFAYCSELQSIKLPKGLKNIEDNAFSRCAKLTSVELPEEVTSIGKFAFFSCSELQSIEFPKGLTSIGDSAFNKCSELKKLELPEGVMGIGEYAFAHCSGLNSVKLPKGLKNIERNTFSGCSKLASVELPEGIINIGEYAFAYCSELQSIKIPISVTYIGKKAFDDHVIIKCNCNSYAYEWAVDNGADVIEVTHKEIEKIEKIEAKCVTKGNYEYYICQKCWKMYQDEKCITELTDAEIVIPALGHKEVVDKAVAPTSTKPGLTEGSHCAVCNEVLKEQIVIEALGTDNPFKDVEEGRFFYDPVLWAVKNNITTGTKPDKFSPDDPCTRAQVVTFLWRAINRPEASNKSAFEDLREGAYYLDAVDWAVENKITTGTSPNTFSPDEACTRAQIVTFLWRVAGCPKPSKESAFEDLREGAYYLDAVSWAVEEGITVGTSPTKFSPDEKCTRAQVVTFLYRYIY